MRDALLHSATRAAYRARERSCLKEASSEAWVTDGLGKESMWLQDIVDGITAVDVVAAVKRQLKRGVGWTGLAPARHPARLYILEFIANGICAYHLPRTSIAHEVRSLKAHTRQQYNGVVVKDQLRACIVGMQLLIILDREAYHRGEIVVNIVNIHFYDLYTLARDGMLDSNRIS